MANKYWVGSVSGSTPASGNWTSATGWRTTSGGLVITTPPGSADIAIFDNNSFLGAAITVTVDAAIGTLGIDASGINTGANGITLASSGTGAIEMRSGSSLTLPASRFTWTMTGALTVRSSSTSTWTTNGVAISSPISLGTSSVLTLGGDLKCTNTFTMPASTINLASYQVFCTNLIVSGSSTTTFNSTTLGAGFTVTGNSGTVVNWTTTFARIVYSSIKPLITLTASGTPSGRTISFSGAGYLLSTPTMPGLKITSGSDTVTFTNSGSSTYINFDSFDSSGFTGTFTCTNAIGSYVYIYGDFVAPNTGITFNSCVYVYLKGTSNKFSCAQQPSSSGVVIDTGASYTQNGAIKTNLLVSGSIILNNTGIINSSYGFNTETTLIGNVSFAGTINLQSGINTTNLTSLTCDGTGGSYITITCPISGSIPVSITNNGSNNLTLNNITSSATTITGNVNNFNFYNVTLANQLIITASSSVIFSGNINIPSSSIITTTQYNSYATYTNAFRINLSGLSMIAWASASGINDPNFYISGSGSITFNDGSTIYQLYCSSFDASASSGVSGSNDIVYVKNSFTGSANSQFPTIKLYPSATGTFTLNTCNIVGFNDNTSTQTVNLGSANIATTSGGFSISSATLNAGTSTLKINGSNVNVGSQNLYNVVVASGSNTITASQINNISNTSQPVTVNFGGNTTFGTFGLSGTAGNLVTVGSTAAAQRTLTKATPWTLANSTDGGNNTGLTFGSTGNNSYLSVSYINGVVLSTATGNMFLMF